MANLSLHVTTPLLRSKKLSDKLGCSVWLKMENMQNSGSFKARGIGNLCRSALEQGCTKLVSSSGGNAGLAATYCARQLGLPITVVVPSSTPDSIVSKLRSEGAQVEVCGKVWDEANERAIQLSSDSETHLIHPFDHPKIWEGHSTLVDEVKEQLGGAKPGLVVLSVGGGGLMNGVLEGMHRVGWGDVPLVAMETHGADSLAACVKAQEWVELSDITSIAKCLGARRVSRKSFEWLTAHPVFSRVVSDREAVSACIRFAADEGVLVPPACGAALAAVYGDTVARLVEEEGEGGAGGKVGSDLRDVVLVVCGGSGVTQDTIQHWKKTFDF